VQLLDAAGNTTVVDADRRVPKRLFSITTTDITRGKRAIPIVCSFSQLTETALFMDASLGLSSSGLSMNASGLISGTPTAFGTFSFACALPMPPPRRPLPVFHDSRFGYRPVAHSLATGDLDQASSESPTRINCCFRRSSAADVGAWELVPCARVSP